MRHAFSAVVAWQLLTIAGCSGSSYPATDLKGSVSVAGTTATQGGITFTPLAANRGKGVFAPIVNGRYEAKHVAVGATHVTFRLTKETGRTIEIYGRTAPEVVNIVPPKYAGGVPIEVRAEDVEKNFELDAN
jgi:hypothetical protein